jgi:hypothetical protein
MESLSAIAGIRSWPVMLVVADGLFPVIPLFDLLAPNQPFG